MSAAPTPPSELQALARAIIAHNASADRASTVNTCWHNVGLTLGISGHCAMQRARAYGLGTVKPLNRRPGRGADLLFARAK